MSDRSTDNAADVIKVSGENAVKQSTLDRIFRLEPPLQRAVAVVRSIDVGVYPISVHFIRAATDTISSLSRRCIAGYVNTGVAGKKSSGSTGMKRSLNLNALEMGQASVTFVANHDCERVASFAVHRINLAKKWKTHTVNTYIVREPWGEMRRTAG